MNKKWCVYDTASRDMIFHDDEEKVQKDFDEAVSMIEDGDESEYKVYMFEVVKEINVKGEL